MSLDRCIAVFFLLISLVYGFSAFNYPLLPFERNMAFLPNTLPLVLSVLGGFLSFVVLLTPKQVESDGKSRFNYQKNHIAQALLLLFAMVLFALTLRPLGFIGSSTLFLTGAGLILGERKLQYLLPIAGLSAFLIWYLVQEVLGIFMRPWPGFMS